MEYPLPSGLLPVNYQNSEGLGYEAEHVRQCIKTGMVQSDIMSLEGSLIVAEIMDSIMKELKTVYFK